jgi:hypothetical protein
MASVNSKMSKSDGLSPMSGMTMIVVIDGPKDTDKRTVYLSKTDHPFIFILYVDLTAKPKRGVEPSKMTNWLLRKMSPKMLMPTGLD